MSLLDSIIQGEVTLATHLYCLFAALLCGIIVAFAASVKNTPTKSFVISLVILPMIVELVITMVNGNIGTGVAVMGAFSLVRFRSVPGKAKDIAALFLAMTSGIACAAGFLGLAVIFTLCVSLVLVALSFIPLGDERYMELHIMIPESLNFSDCFDDLFKSYTKKHTLTKVKTSNMGSLYMLHYKIQMNDRNKIQEFIDKLRCRNGNLEISIFDAPENGEAI